MVPGRPFLLPFVVLLPLVVAWSLDRPDANPSGAAGGAGADADCRGFGGRIHGTSACVRLNPATGATSPLQKRPMPQDPGVASASCDEKLSPGHAELVVRCVASPLPSDGGSYGRHLTVSVDVLPSAPDAGTPRRVKLDEQTISYSFIRVWAVERTGGIDLVIDYGVDD